MPASPSLLPSSTASIAMDSPNGGAVGANVSNAMDVDGPPMSGTGTPLKRCSSAPMINETSTTTTMTATNSAGASHREQPNFNPFGTRTRRFSASFSPVPGSPVSSGLRLTPRINQLRQEEHADLSNQRELAHEREIHHAMQISQSWEDLSLMNETSHADAKRMLSTTMAPLHVSLPPYGPSLTATASGAFLFSTSSPSPTRLAASPGGFQSPTRTSRTAASFVRRSASPVLRPSPLGVKRKLDDDKIDFFRTSPRAKRFYSCSERGNGGLLAMSGSSGGNGSGSSGQGGSLTSSVGTPESLSSADSPNYNFRNVDSPSPGGGGTTVNNLQAEPMMVGGTKNDHEMNENSS